ncbi:UPF0481 protein At3g47200-like [Diospyros lotus]|uniref:UPF0481 protein At3g47200-like n=1 Tax=Diospyros lotus TaxID=55363 RepID=UPI002252A539|nr:UPF0481 protein At3g47200-like [Diospyros lotus]
MSQWVIDMKAELDKLGNAQSREEQSRKKPSIYKLPSLIFDLNTKAYKPEAVSFGPYHHGDPRLQPMEDHKQRALLLFLKRSPKPLDKIFDSMVKVAQKLKDSYDSLPPKWKDETETENFVKLMIVDGCFVLEILRASDFESDYFDDDPIFGPHGKLYAMPFIKRDMLLLENQLPMLVLFKLKGIKENRKGDADTLNKQILKFHDRGDLSSNMGKCLHILDLYRKSLLCEEATKSTEQKGSKGPDNATVVRSATELNEAGIRFRRSESNSLKDISFNQGVLRLPEFVVDDATESTFLNLIAFERCHVGVGHDITSFICFMDIIVDHDRDIGLLCSKRIIQNLVGNDKVAADLFNAMSKDLMMDPSSHLNMVHESILSYCTEPRHKWRAALKHTYFRNPWAIISVVAAIILFGLATLSTVYDVIGK